MSAGQDGKFGLPAVDANTANYPGAQAPYSIYAGTAPFSDMSVLNQNATADEADNIYSFKKTNGY